MRTSKKQQTELSSEGGTLVNSVIKALHILEGFTLSQQELTLSQISRQQGLPKKRRRRPPSLEGEGKRQAFCPGMGFVDFSFSENYNC